MFYFLSGYFGSGWISARCTLKHFLVNLIKIHNKNNKIKKYMHERNIHIIVVQLYLNLLKLGLVEFQII
jgi:hypothetical protein